VNRLALALIAIAVGCSSSDPPATTDTGAPVAKGTATLRFAVNSTVRNSPRLVDPLKGKIYGAIYLSADVGLGGPREGAEQVASVLLDVDLTAEGPSAATFQVPSIPEDKYVFTGFLDVDGNGSETERPDDGDPVTLPSSETQFDVVGDTNTDATITFNLVYGF
jgi:hypothetical protein